jgi:hypothetical protein
VVRVLACHAKSRGFDSRLSRLFIILFVKRVYINGKLSAFQAEDMSSILITRMVLPVNLHWQANEGDIFYLCILSSVG